MEAHKIQAEQLEEQFREMLDECYPYEICGMIFRASAVLERMDPIAYRESLLNYADSVIQDGEFDEDVSDYL